MGRGQGHCCSPLPALSKLPSHFFVSLCKTRIGPPYRAALSENLCDRIMQFLACGHSVKIFKVWFKTISKPIF